MSINKKIIIFSTLVCIVLIIVLTKEKDLNISTSTKSLEKTKERLSTYYKLPIASMVTSDEDKIKISAGFYRYGDIIKDGEIDEYDVNGLEMYLNKETNLDKDSISLADINGDGLVNKIDLLLLKDYVENAEKIKYNTKEKTVYYCITTKNDISSCNWVNNNDFNVEVGKYYIFIKDKEDNTSKLVYTHKLIEETENELLEE